ncbi:hypothetical protein H2200_000970 [Cladophialophora chaetospira]|uniref:Ribokinase n=1 Tax=Cladophialophora chaetospira TaxID=386627 RepID=A0AA38XQJ7_9EURO|nr:hypothetical protein H2200_000970 [Cladophialophora chaetospira]
MSRKPRICVIGSLNVDFVTSTPRVPGPGETLTATSLKVHAGGKGANQAVACGKAAFTSPGSQDVTVEMIGAVGADDPYYASLLKPTLEQSGVSTAGVEELEGVQTGTATILVDEGSDGENRILVVPGANAEVSDASKILDLATRNGVPEVVVMQGEIPRGTVLELLKWFNSSEYKTSVVFNPAPMFPDGIPLTALKNLAVLVVNETECRQLFKASKELDNDKLSGNEDDPMNISELTQLTTSLHQKAHINIVVVTLGSRGVYFSHSIETGYGEQISAAKVEKVVDTTAAGDSFVGYFATALARHLAQADQLQGFNVKEAASKANWAAAKCVQRSGAMESIPFGYE